MYGCASRRTSSFSRHALIVAIAVQPSNISGSVRTTLNTTP
jgi:hypothetical protein